MRFSNTSLVGDAEPVIRGRTTAVSIFASWESMSMEDCKNIFRLPFLSFTNQIFSLSINWHW